MSHQFLRLMGPAVSSILIQAHDAIEGCECEEGCAACELCQSTTIKPLTDHSHPNHRHRQSRMQGEQPRQLKARRADHHQSHTRPTHRCGPAHRPQRVRNPRDRRRSVSCESHRGRAGRTSRFGLIGCAAYLDNLATELQISSKASMFSISKYP